MISLSFDRLQLPPPLLQPLSLDFDQQGPARPCSALPASVGQNKARSNASIARASLQRNVVL